MIEEEMSKIDERGLEKLGTLHSSEKTNATDYGRQVVITDGKTKKGIKGAFFFRVKHGENVMSAQMVEVSIWSRNGAPSRKGSVVNGQRTKARTNEYPSPVSWIWDICAL